MILLRLYSTSSILFSKISISLIALSKSNFVILFILISVSLSTSLSVISLFNFLTNGFNSKWIVEIISSHVSSSSIAW